MTWIPKTCADLRGWICAIRWSFEVVLSILALGALMAVQVVFVVLWMAFWVVVALLFLAMGAMGMRIHAAIKGIGGTKREA